MDDGEPAPVRRKLKLHAVDDGALAVAAEANAGVDALQDKLGAPSPQAAAACAEDAPPAPSKAPVIGVVVVGTSDDDSPEAAIRSAGEGRPVVFVASDPASQAAAIARRAGAAVVGLDDQASSTGGRARNAGYRQLKALAPDIAYVQFLVAGSALHPDWLANAAQFMARRPEVEIVEGATGERYPKPSIFAAASFGETFRAGETQAAGPVMLARVEGFEAAGGFRNDLKAGETEDLCLRLRRRGRHIWRLNAPMAVREIQPANLADWWSSAVGRGFDFAYATALHGRAPERFRAPETAQAVIWGGLYPMFVFGSAVVGGGAAYLLGRSLDSLLIAAAIISLGCSVYGLRWLSIAARRGRAEAGARFYGLYAAFRHIPEFFGVVKFWFSPDKPRRSGSRAV